MADDSRIREAFERAKNEFHRDLEKPALVAEIQKVSRMQDVYDATAKIQEEQAARGHLRHLGRIQPFLKQLDSYHQVVTTFVQVQPGILALIWGPIKLLLEFTQNAMRSFDAIVSTMAEIGDKLPIFTRYTAVLHSNDRIKEVLYLFFKDILDFYLTALKFFAAKRWELLFESMWPRHKKRIDLVGTNIEHHVRMMVDEVTLEDITEAHKARDAAFVRYERTQKFEERQDYESVEAFVKPRLYDHELDQLRRMRCNDTGRWLQKDKTMCRWLDYADSKTRLVWLQGIPGAGKTFLASDIVESARTRTRSSTLFVFLSYKESGNTFAISILHSLIFQLASENTNIQMTLSDIFQSSRRKLKSNTEFVQETFSNMLKCMGPTYIILDGLDEITKFERQTTLDVLLTMLNSCDKMKLLISSRPEDGISKVLLSSAQPVRVDSNNAGCLQTYISRRKQNWLLQSEFNTEMRSEISKVLAPLAAKAKGMFLYARIVMDTIETYSSLDEVRSFRVLPETLDHAYARVIERLNDLPPNARGRARSILGWIGCSPVPLTHHEIKQALAIQPGQLDCQPQADISLNFVQLCGPIVEVFGDEVHFVHFTVKEYLFCQRTETSVSLLQATIDLTTRCLTYLSLDLFEPDNEDERFAENILLGGYRLHAFATSQWFVLLQKCVRMLHNEALPNKLIKSHDDLVIQRGNMDYEGQSEHASKKEWLKLLVQETPMLHTTISAMSKFQLLDIGDWRLDGDDSWTGFDPLTLSSSSVRIYKQFEAMLCPGSRHKSGCSCSRLKSLYGPRLFRCNHVICHSQRIAFETRSLRNSHTARHDRLFKCTVSTCDFAKIGFWSDRQRQQHQLRCHEDPTPTPSRLTDNPSDDEVQPLLFDLVTMGKLEEVRQLLPQFCALEDYVKLQLKILAVCSGSRALPQLLTEAQPPAKCDWVYLAAEAIRSENIEVLDWVVLKEDFWQAAHLNVAHQAAISASDDMFNFWKKTLLSRGESKDVFHLGLLEAARNPVQEIRLGKLWKELASHRKYDQAELQNALPKIVSTGCSLVLAKTLIEYGAQVNIQSTEYDGEGPPLYVAATRSTKRSAEMMKFLLLAGADPEGRVDSRHHKMKRPSRLVAAQRISKHLGMTWDELVEWTQEQRKTKTELELLSYVETDIV